MPDHKHPPGPPMTLGNMRELGVHHLFAYCHNDARRIELYDGPKFLLCLRPTTVTILNSYDFNLSKGLADPSITSKSDANGGRNKKTA
jgi:hypothetical protein